MTPELLAHFKKYAQEQLEAWQDTIDVYLAQITDSKKEIHNAVIFVDGWSEEADRRDNDPAYTFMCVTFNNAELGHFLVLNMGPTRFAEIQDGTLKPPNYKLQILESLIS